MTLLFTALLILDRPTASARADEWSSATLMRRLSGAMLKADVMLARGEYHVPADGELVAARDALDAGLAAVDRAVGDCGETLFPVKVREAPIEARRAYGRAYREHMLTFRATLVEYQELLRELERLPESDRRTEALRRHRARIREVINAAHRELKAS